MKRFYWFDLTLDPLSLKLYICIHRDLREQRQIFQASQMEVSSFDDPKLGFDHL